MRKDLYTNGSVDIPKISKGRSFFDLSHSSHIDMNIGILYPIDQAIEIIPGDTFDYSHRLNIRMTNPPKAPTMDQLVFDIYFFYVPNRIVWDDWDKFITNNSGGDFYQDYSGTIPVVQLNGLNPGSYSILTCSVMDYLGYNAGIVGNNAGLNPILLPIRGYYKVWNEYFRYESLQHPILVPTGNSNHTVLAPSTLTYYQATTSSYYDSTWNTNHNLALYSLYLMPVNRLPGYFSRALTQPLAGDDVSILSEIQIGDPLTGTRVKASWTGAPGSGKIGALNYSSSTQKSELDNGTAAIDAISGPLISSDNSIRALSQAFALNKFLYIDNVYGKRITEWTYGHFGVNVPDSRVQRPEFLAKKRIYININQIMQSSETGTSPQGNAGAWSQSFDAGKDFVKSFVEYGWLLSLGCVRVLNHTYSQGSSSYWYNRTRYDFYLPEFNNVGDQPVFEREIYMDNNHVSTVWGYQERYAQYKMIPSRVAGIMKPQVSGNLSLWTYTDYYTVRPTLSATWMFEPHANFNNTIYVADSVAPSFILDYVADLKAYRSMPYHSIPGGLTGSW